MNPLIMIIEDEEAIVTMLRYNLEKEGFDVCSCSDGNEAFKEVKINNPSLVLLDWMLPGMSGIEICKQIRYDHSLRNLPVIMLTARGEELDKIKGVQCRRGRLYDKTVFRPRTDRPHQSFAPAFKTCGNSGRTGF